MSQDSLIRGLAFDQEIRIFVADASQTVAEAQESHESWSASTAALGRTMIGTLLLGATLKGEDTITVRVVGDGPAGYIVSEADGKGHVKGHIKNPHVSLDLNEVNKLDVRGAVGQQGDLIVTKDLGLKEPYEGRVNLVSGEIAEDFTYYMAASEQTPSAFGLGVLVNTDETVPAAGGFMVQVMPGASEETVSQIEENLEKLPPITDLIHGGKNPEDIMNLVCQGGQPQVLSEMAVAFHCDCSKDRFAHAMASLEAEEIQAMIDEDEGAEAVCHFCRKKYQYTVEDLEDIMNHQA